MTEQLKEIGIRISELRKTLELSEETFAEKTGVSLETLKSYEKGELDFSFSFLSNAAHALGVDVIDLMSGENPKLSSCSLVRNGQGLSVDRRAAYSYKHLAFTFRHKMAEPFLVTVQPKDQSPVLHAHTGQEFNYLLSGRLEVHLGKIIYVLNPGDSVYFDSSIPHAMQALDGAPAAFLAVVMNLPEDK